MFKFNSNVNYDVPKMDTTASNNHSFNLDIQIRDVKYDETYSIKFEDIDIFKLYKYVNTIEFDCDYEFALFVVDLFTWKTIDNDKYKFVVKSAVCKTISDLNEFVCTYCGCTFNLNLNGVNIIPRT